jgi:diguanylate cyclase (GGDEF)-like protein/PAS domain S-box-containing protein
MHRYRVRYAKELSEANNRERELQKISAIIASTEDAIVGIALDGTITSWNDGAERMLGFPQEEIVGQSVYILIPESLHNEEESLLARVRKGELVKHYETLRKNKNGMLINISVTLSPIRDSNGNVVGASKITRDITEKKKIEAELSISAAAFETYDAIMITDSHGNIIKVNHAFSKVTGYKAEEILGKNPRFLNSGKHDYAFFTELFKKLSQDGSWMGEIWDKRKNGDIFPTSMTITAVKNELHILKNYVAIFNDITDRKNNDEMVSRFAFYDTLTQLPNRRLLDDRLEQAIATSKRSGNYGALMFLDLDNFKPLNDKHGHKAGDLLLVEVARRLTSCVREVDTVARFGGDEFVVLLSELNKDEIESGEQARVVAEKIRTLLSQPYWLTSNPSGSTKMIVHHNVGASIGVALLNEKSNSEKLLKYADKAMYEAKESGRNSVRFYKRKTL